MIETCASRPSRNFFSRRSANATSGLTDTSESNARYTRRGPVFDFRAIDSQSPSAVRLPVTLAPRQPNTPKSEMQHKPTDAAAHALKTPSVLNKEIAVSAISDGSLTASKGVARFS